MRSPPSAFGLLESDLVRLDYFLALHGFAQALQLVGMARQGRWVLQGAPSSRTARQQAVKGLFWTQARSESYRRLESLVAGRLDLGNRS